MNRRQAINYLSNSGFSMIQIETIVKALSTLSEVDFKELKDRYGDEVEYVVRDMISGENLRWVELPRPKRQEPTTKNETLVSLDVYKQVAKERDIAIQQLHELGYDFGQKIEPTTKNDLGVDCISRAEAIKCLECDFDITGKENMKTVVNYINSAHDKIVNLPRVKQEPFKPMVEIDLDYVIKQKYIEREVLDEIRAEISTVYESLDGYDPDSLGHFLSEIDKILDKYKAESEE